MLWSQCRCIRAFFFFSSRRRHTRYWRDWSSDVCSSDLNHLRETGVRADRLELEITEGVFLADGDSTEDTFAKLKERSEERRVGKECKGRWARDHSNKKQR